MKKVGVPDTPARIPSWGLDHLGLYLRELKQESKLFLSKLNLSAAEPSPHALMHLDFRRASHDIPKSALLRCTMGSLAPVGLGCNSLTGKSRWARLL